jgi:hypothetical protein
VRPTHRDGLVITLNLKKVASVLDAQRNYRAGVHYVALVDSKKPRGIQLYHKVIKRRIRYKHTLTVHSLPGFCQHYLAVSADGSDTNNVLVSDDAAQPTLSENEVLSFLWLRRSAFDRQLLLPHYFFNTFIDQRWPDGLKQKVRGMGIKRVQGKAVMGSYEDQAVSKILRRINNLESIHSRHVDIEKDDVRSVLSDSRHSALTFFNLSNELEFCKRR